MQKHLNKNINELPSEKTINKCLLDNKFTMKKTIKISANKNIDENKEKRK